MPVDVMKTAGARAEITWERGDDPHGWIARSVESDELAYALQSLGDERGDALRDREEEYALQSAYHTTRLARLLELRAAVQIVRLRDERGLSWRRIAGVVHNDPEKQSTVRRQYEAGRRHLGLPLTAAE
jgi:hypothetical protein